MDEGPREPEHGDHHGCCFLQPPPSGREVERVLRGVGREEELEVGKPPTRNSRLQRPLANLQDSSPPLKYLNLDSHWKVRQFFLTIQMMKVQAHSILSLQGVRLGEPQLGEAASDKGQQGSNKTSLDTRPGKT